MIQLVLIVRTNGLIDGRREEGLEEAKLRIQGAADGVVLSCKHPIQIDIECIHTIRGGYSRRKKKKVSKRASNSLF